MSNDIETAAEQSAIAPWQLASIALAVAAGWVTCAPGCRGSSSSPEPPAPAASPQPVAASDGAEHAKNELRWVAVGGGASPDSNQVSIEQDLQWLSRELAGPGALYFAGGLGTRTVQVASPRLPSSPQEEVLGRLGQLFAPRSGRDATYRATVLSPQGPGTADAFLQAAQEAIRQPGSPLLLYVAAHGDKGEAPRDAAVALWAGSVLQPEDIASVLEDDARKRDAVLIVSACYGGGFAEIAFVGADPDRGPAPHSSCALFAAPWDEVSSGCDPNPDRRAQEGFGVHFLHALRGQDHLGQPLALAELDVDGDGTVGWLDALTRVRIASRSVELPTTTSERWLREEAPAEEVSPTETAHLPEEQAVVAALSSRLGGASLDEVRGVIKGFEERSAALTAQRDKLMEEEEKAFHQAAAAVLNRWPVLDDPWHPAFLSLLQEHTPEIAAFLDESPEVRGAEEAASKLDEVAARLDAIKVAAAPYKRIERALVTQQLAGRLRAKGGPAWARFEALRACERQSPALEESR